MAMNAVTDLLSGYDREADTLKQMQDLKSLAPEDLALMYPLFDAISNDECIHITAGSKAMIDANAERFDVIDTMYLDEEDGSMTKEELVEAVDSMDIEEAQEFISGLEPDEVAQLFNGEMESIFGEGFAEKLSPVIDELFSGFNEDWSEKAPEDGQENTKADDLLQSIEDLFSGITEDDIASWITDLFSELESPDEGGA